MRRAALAVTALLALWAPDAHGQTVGAQVITRAEIEAAGWTRLSELVFAIRGFARSSVDGIAVQPAAGLLSTSTVLPEGGGVAVFLDDQPIDPTVAGAQLLDLLPVALTQLDSVVAERRPAAAGGDVAMHGVVRLYTRRTRGGITGSLSHYSGNEVGDAGPFAFTERATPNVDNSGPFHEGRLAGGTAAFDADVALRRWTDNLTDRRIAERHTAAAAPSSPDLWVRHLAPTVRAGTTAGGSRHDVHAGLARLQGTFFLPALQHEQSLVTGMAFAGVSGSVRPLGLAYRVSGSQVRSAAYDAPLPSTLAHRRRRLEAAITQPFALGGWSLAAGASARRFDLLDAPALDGRSRRVFTVDVAGHVDAASAQAWHPRLSAALRRGIAGPAGSAVLTLSPLADSVRALVVTIAADARALGDDGAWVDHELLGAGDVAASRRGRAVADVALAHRVRGGAWLTVGGVLRRDTGLRLAMPLQAGEVVPHARDVASAPASLTSGEVRLDLQLPPSGPVAGGATWRIGRALGGVAGAREAARATPGQLLDASVVFVPFADIRVRPALQLASRTHWLTADGAATVPAVARVDLSLEKWFVRRHVRAQLVARNLLNDVERYHPLGADFRLRVYAGATLTF